MAALKDLVLHHALLSFSSCSGAALQDSPWYSCKIIQSCGSSKVGTLFFPSWKRQKSNRACCQYSSKKQAVGIVKILSIQVAKRGKRRVEWGKAQKNQAWIPSLNLSKAPVQSGLGDIV
jgi:hypothetical protein